LIDGTDIVFHLAIYQQQWPNFCKQTKVNIPFVKWFNLGKILPFLQKKIVVSVNANHRNANTWKKVWEFCLLKDKTS
jgi:hypothetical protein